MTALEEMGEAIGRSLEENAEETLAVLLGAVIALALDMAEQRGADPGDPIRIEGSERNLTIHPAHTH